MSQLCNPSDHFLFEFDPGGVLTRRRVIFQVGEKGVHRSRHGKNSVVGSISTNGVLNVMCSCEHVASSLVPEMFLRLVFDPGGYDTLVDYFVLVRMNVSCGFVVCWSLIFI